MLYISGVERCGPLRATESKGRPMKKQSLWSMLKEAVSNFSRDDALTLAGALAFYSALALSPLLVLFLTASSLLGEDTQASMIQEMETVIGPEASQMVETVIQHAGQQADVATWAGVLGLVALAFSATAVFAQLQFSLNRIWDVQTKRDAGYWAWIRRRLLGLLMIFVIGLLLLGSVIVTTALGMILPQGGWIWQVVNFLVTAGVLVLLFAAIFKYLPDVEVEWKNVWAGAILTAVLFTIGRHLIGLYLSYSSVGSAYGAAGSLIVLLLWVYYSACIVFLGAELTQAYAHQSGGGMKPSEYAEWVPEAQAKRKHAA
jgi:membrane protein